MTSVMTNILMGLGSVLTTYLYSYMHRTFYEYRDWAKEKKTVVWLVYVLMWGVMFGCILLEFPPANMIASIMAYVIPVVACYKVSNVRGFAYFAFYMVGVMAMEAIVGASTGALSDNMGFKTRYDVITPQISLIMNFFEMMLVVSICRFGRKDKKKNFNRITIQFMIIPVVSLVFVIADMIIIANGMIDYYSVDQYIQMSIMLIAINILTFYVLEKHTNVLEHEMELAQAKLMAESDADIIAVAAKNMKDRLEMTEQIVQQDRVMRHDRRHFEALMLQLLENGKLDEAKKCLEERLAIEPHGIRRYCDNTTVNAAISHYCSIAEKKNIVVNVSANIPADLSVDDTELAITVSNLLENAINACELVAEEERYIKFTAKYKSQLLLEIENSCTEKVKLDENGHPYSKVSGHGIGTRSALAFANKTDSDIQYIAEDKSFKVRMLVGA